MQSNTYYLYEYEHNHRLRNAGFLKLQTASDSHMIRLHIKSPALGSGISWHLYAFSSPSGSCTLYPLDTVISDHQSLHLQIHLSETHLPATVKLSQIDGLWLSGDSSRYFVASWHQGFISSENVSIYSEKEHASKTPDHEVQSHQDPVPTCTSSDSAVPENRNVLPVQEELTGTDMVSVDSSEDSMEEISEAESTPSDTTSEPIVPTLHPALDSPPTCQKISRQDLKHLPRRYWPLANNSFLLHGYYAYHHLIYIEHNQKGYLGVPGIFSQKEQHAARLFGFPEFSQDYLTTLKLDSDECSGCDHFGYWIRPVF